MFGGIQMQTKSIAIQPSNSFPPSQPRIENLDTAFNAVTSLIMLLMIGVSIYAVIPKDWQHLLRFNSSQKIPCRRCQYFNDNQFLKCALHPITTLTKQAVDCSDYCPHRQKNQSKQASPSLSARISWRGIVQNMFNK
jgi:hypothetical protein